MCIRQFKHNVERFSSTKGLNSPEIHISYYMSRTEKCRFDTQTCIFLCFHELQHFTCNLLLTLSSVYIWNLIFNDFEWLSVLGTSIFPILVGSLSMAWVYKTYKLLKGKEKYIWMIISIGLGLHVIGNLIWFLCAVNKILYKAPDISYLIWLLAYFLFLKRWPC